MDFVKKYPLLCTVIALLLAAFAAQAVLVFLEKGKADKARAVFQQTERQYKGLLQPTDPKALALLSANVERIAAAIRDEQAAVASVVKGLSGNSQALGQEKAPTNGRDLLFNLQGFVDRMNGEASKEADIVNPQTGVTETKPQIKVAPGFSFGFGKYLGTDVKPPADSAVAGIFHQRQILEYLLRTLFNSRPKNQPLELVSVEREIVTGEVVTQKEGGAAARAAGGARRDRGASAHSEDLFEINKLVSARVKGAIEAQAFRLKFIGYTDALRNFLGALGKYDLPLVVRSVEVLPANKSAAARRPAAKPAGFDALFGSTATATVSKAAAVPGQKPFIPKAPVVTDNLSEFTVVIEYIRVIDPEQVKAAKAAEAKTAE